LNITSKLPLIVALGLISGISYVTCNVAIAASKSVPASGEFDQIQTITSPRLSIKSVDHVTFKGIRYTMQSVDPQTFVPYEDIADGQSYYHFVPSSSAAMRVAMKDKPEGALDELKDQTTAKIQGLLKAGNAMVDGYSCDIFVKDLGDGAKVTMFRSTDAQFPYIVKTTLSVPAKELVQTNEIDNVKLGGIVDDSSFILPKGTKIVVQPTDSGASQSGNGVSSVPPAPSGSATPSTPSGQPGQ
jgi:hypothetical protein